MTKLPLARFPFPEERFTVYENGFSLVEMEATQEDIHLLHVKSDRIQLVVLPFQGQQIWRAKIDGRDLTMKSLVTRPVLTADYLRNYGAFLVHCGATAMGGPSEKDNHPIHGELPNAPYNNAWIEVGADSEGKPFVEIHGEYFHEVAMTGSYLAHPVIRVTQGSNLVEVSMAVTNKAGRPMNVMYMGHINFMPVDDSSIVATHEWKPETMRVISNLPAHVREKATPEFLEYLDSAGRNPEVSSSVPLGQSFDPELVAEIDYVGDEHGQAHTLIVHPSGTSDYLGHDVASTPFGIRYIQRTPDHDCVGTGPSTSCVTGRAAQTEKGNFKLLAPGETFSTSFVFGALGIEETSGMKQRIENVMGNIQR